jgi:hypothetical protein
MEQAGKAHTGQNRQVSADRTLQTGEIRTSKDNVDQKDRLGKIKAYYRQYIAQLIRNMAISKI